MDKGKHTAGPWITRNGLTVETAHEHHAITIACTSGGIKEQRANARLIAAAPELLEALGAVVRWDTEHPISYVEFEKIRTQARAAIRKATEGQ